MTYLLKQIPVYVVWTDKDSHFTGSLAQNAMEVENISGLPFQSGTIVGVVIQSDQNLDWDVFVWGKDELDNTDLDLDTFLGHAKLVVADGERIAGAGQYYYDTATASGYAFRGIRFADLDKTRELHVGLVNRNATAKNAGATGEVRVGFVVVPDEAATVSGGRVGTMSNL